MWFLVSFSSVANMLMRNRQLLFTEHRQPQHNCVVAVCALCLVPAVPCVVLWSVITTFLDILTCFYGFFSLCLQALHISGENMQKFPFIKALGRFETVISIIVLLASVPQRNQFGKSDVFSDTHCTFVYCCYFPPFYLTHLSRKELPTCINIGCFLLSFYSCFIILFYKQMVENLVRRHIKGAFYNTFDLH